MNTKPRAALALAGAFDAVDLALVWCLADGRIAHVNRAARALLAWQGRRRPRTVWQPAAGLDTAALRALWPAPGGAVARGLVGVRRAEGAPALLGAVLAPLRARHGQAPGVLVQFSDVTERVDRQVRDSQADKLEAVGRLGAGIAHEINTPLQFVGDNLRFLGEAADALIAAAQAGAALRAVCAQVPALAGAGALYDTATAGTDLAFFADEAPLAVHQSVDGIARVTQIVRALRDYTHPGSGEHGPVDLNRLLEAVTTLTRNEWKYVAEMHLDLAPDLPAVTGDAGALNQVFVNLLVNAGQAIGEQARDRPGTITVTTTVRDGGVEACVSDDGPGVPAALRERIFEPFFTTKDVGKGTGQGLALVHRIVTTVHHGRLTLRDAPGGGAQFAVWLPADAPP